MTKKRIIGLVLWCSGIALYFALENDAASLISGFLVASSIFFLTAKAT
ncbi:hypothetical protein [Gelidibacter algens]|jgi:hypothetical protein|nr:hypothetical protein [Gelidibacter algens]